MGSGRSGSTWLAGLLASPFRYRLLFEPFHPEHVPGADLAADRYYAPGAVPIEVSNFIDRALNDRINSEWIAQSSNRRLGMHRWRWWPKVRVVKCIRGNLIIPALRYLYGPTLPIVVLLRNPGAVVESMMRVRFPWAFDLSTLISQDEFAQKYTIPLKALGGCAAGPVEQVTVRWLVENLYLIKNAEGLGVRLVFYEDLVADPVAQITRLCYELDIDVFDGLEEKVSKPSYTTHPRSPAKKGHFSPGAWRAALPPADVRKIETLLASVDFTYPR